MILHIAGIASCGTLHHTHRGSGGSQPGTSWTFCHDRFRLTCRVQDLLLLDHDRDNVDF